MSDEHEQVGRRGADAEHEARRRLALAQIRQWPDPVLKLRAQEVEEFDDDLRRLVERMHQLMHDANGVGLAGNQVGRAAAAVRLPARRRGRPRRVNPRIVDAERRARDRRRGLPLAAGRARPGRAARGAHARGPGRRTATPYRLELEGLGARVVQHEFDHLDGVLIIERTTPEARREAMADPAPAADPRVRLGFAASAPFGADVLGRLAAKHEIAFCLTQPDAPARPGARSPARRRRS